MKKLKAISDNSKFKLSKKGVTYTLNTLIRSNKKAVFTSDKSQLTFVRGWDTNVIPA